METSPKLNFKNLKENSSQVTKKKEADMDRKMLKAMLVFSMLFSSILLPQQPANAAVSSSVKSQIRTLFYGSQQAFQKSTAAGIAYIESHNYPGSVKTSSSLYQRSMGKEELMSKWMGMLNLKRRTSHLLNRFDDYVRDAKKELK